MLEVISELVLASVTALFILPNLSVVSLGDSGLRVNPNSPQSPPFFPSSRSPTHFDACHAG